MFEASVAVLSRIGGAVLCKAASLAMGVLCLLCTLSLLRAWNSGLIHLHWSWRSAEKAGNDALSTVVLPL